MSPFQTYMCFLVAINSFREYAGANDPRSIMYSALFGDKSRSNKTILKTEKSISQIECGIICSNEDDCGGFNIITTSAFNICELTEGSSGPEDIMVDPKSVFFGKDDDKCSSDPCQNGGSCVDGVNGYSCDCQSGCQGPHCETVTLTAMPGVTCTASSSETTSMNCEHAFDGIRSPGINNEWASRGESEGFWIKIKFVKEARVKAADIWFRCMRGDQFGRIQFGTAGGEHIELTRTCAGSDDLNDWNRCVPPKETFNLRSLSAPTEFIKITGYGDCAGGGNSGFVEVEIWEAQ